MHQLCQTRKFEQAKKYLEFYHKMRHQFVLFKLRLSTFLNFLLEHKQSSPGCSQCRSVSVIMVSGPSESKSSYVFMVSYFIYFVQSKSHVSIIEHKHKKDNIVVHSSQSSIYEV